MKKLTLKEIEKKQDHIQEQVEILMEKKLRMEKQIQKLKEDYRSLENLKQQKEDNSNIAKNDRSFEVSSEAKALASQVLGF